MKIRAAHLLLWCLAVTGCSAVSASDTKATATLSQGGGSASSSSSRAPEGAAGAPDHQLSDRELDRLLDTLEQEIGKKALFDLE